MRKLSLSSIYQLLTGAPLHSSMTIEGVSVDSRAIRSGELFVALVGERVDGHTYLPEVQKKGACAAIVSKAYHGPDYGMPLIRVEDPLHALQDLAKAVLSQQNARVVAVTGSIGKTTTKEFIKTLLSKRYRVAASPGNSNSQVGVPLAILNHTTGEEEIIVLEMGMTMPGQISRLVQIAPPEVAVLTTVALVHACNFDRLEDIARAKGEIFSHFKTKLGLLHREICNYEDILQIGSCRKVSFSTTAKEADYYLNKQENNTIFSALEKQAFCLGKLTLPGEHNLHNFLAATAVARYFNVPWEDIKASLKDLALPDKRLQFIQKSGMTFLNDSYNASELSVKAALETLPEAEAGGSKIAVLGSMMELGKFSDDCHRRVGEFALNHVEKVYCLGEECRPIYEVWKKAGKPVDLFTDRKSLVDYLRQILKPSDVVLLKGSRSKELWKVLEEL